MTRNFLREKISLGKPVCGLWSILPSVMLSEIISLSNFDFQILDMEHGAYDFGTLDAAIRASESGGCSPLVRIAGTDAIATQKALDLGAHGIIYPQVNSAAEAAAAVQLTKYAPQGTRGFNPFTRVSDYGLSTITGTRNKNEFAMAGVIIESKAAASDLDQILTTPNLEIVYLGAYDMSVALGTPGDMKNPLLLEFLEDSVLKIRHAKKIAGVMAQSAEDMKRYLDLGANFIVAGVDSNLIGKSLSASQSLFSKLV